VPELDIDSTPGFQFDEPSQHLPLRRPHRLDLMNRVLLLLLRVGWGGHRHEALGQ